MPAWDAFLGLMLHKRRLHLPVNLGVGSNLLEERCKRIRQLLDVPQVNERAASSITSSSVRESRKKKVNATGNLGRTYGLMLHV